MVITLIKIVPALTLLALATTLLSACGLNLAATVEETPYFDPVNQFYPAPAISGYPPPGSSYPYPSPQETPDPTLATSEGAVFYSGRPLAFVSVFMTQAIDGESGGDPNERIYTITDRRGAFTFTNLQPGAYALFLDSAGQVYRMYNPDGAQLLIEIAGNATISVGNLDLADLPGGLPAYPYPAP